MPDAMIRIGSEEDLDVVHTLNQNEAKWTSDLTHQSLIDIVGYTSVFLVSTREDRVTGFLLAMLADSGYPNANLAWFRESHTDFLYIDRIVVSKLHAGQGIGKALYERGFAIARELGCRKAVCEYSTKPMNDGSAAFHKSMGFQAVGVREDPSTAKVLSMQLREI